MSEDRIIELEIKLAYQDELLDSLNMVVASQQKQIDKLEETSKLLNDRIKSLSEQTSNKGQQYEIPPHY